MWQVLHRGKGPEVKAARILKSWIVECETCDFSVVVEQWEIANWMEKVQRHEALHQATHQESHIKPPGFFHTADDPDEMYVKYRVFREPEEAQDHPVDVQATWMDQQENSGALWEVEDFIFVLKPDTDHHARVALGAYIESVRPFKPQLAKDLAMVLEDMT